MTWPVGAAGLAIAAADDGGLATTTGKAPLGSFSPEPEGALGELEEVVPVCVELEPELLVLGALELVEVELELVVLEPDELGELLATTTVVVVLAVVPPVLLVATF